MPDYSNSVVYKIYCKDQSVTECYVGSTTDLCHRSVAHKTQCNNDKSKGHNSPVYKFIRANGGWQNWTMEVLQSYPECATKAELLKYERLHMESLKASLNRDVPGRTKREYDQAHREQKRNYYQAHRDQRREQMRKWRRAHREQRLEKIECQFCGSTITRNGMARHQRTKKCLAARDAEL